MHLNHMNLGVTDVIGTAKMLETYFGLKNIAGSFNDEMSFLTDDSGSLIAIFKADDVIYPKIFHVGFMLDDQEQVNAMHERLMADGFAPEAPREEYGRYTFYFKAPGGFLIEVNSPFQQRLRNAVKLNNE